MVKRVLMIAFHFPPLRGGSGIQRTLKFSQYLPEHGWQPLVLSAHPRAYVHTGADQMAEIAPDAVVRRCFALDASRHLAVRGRYSALMALPDRWSAWLLGAVPAGWRMVRRYRPQLIWSTYPIATAHLIALVLHRLTGLPWVADLRDPMTDDGYPSDPLTRRVSGWIEAQTIARCSAAVCTTPGAIRAYQARFPHIPADRYALIENGYDEENFVQAARTGHGSPGAAAASDVAAAPTAGIAIPAEAPHASAQESCFVLLHSGVIYPSERDPEPLFQALAALLAGGQIDAARLQVKLRATGHDAYLRPLLRRYGIETVVTLLPPLPYRAALAEMLHADGLLILQASNCNHQIPAKLYEYLRAGRPLLALTDAVGDTAAVLRKAGIDTIAALDSREQIVRALPRFVALARAGAAPLASAATVAANSRRARSRELGELLNRVAQAAGVAPARQPIADSGGAP